MVTCNGQKKTCKVKQYIVGDGKLKVSGGQSVSSGSGASLEVSRYLTYRKTNGRRSVSLRDG